MRCKFCGTTLPEHAKFCPGCGKEIDNARERHESREASNIPEDAYYTKVIEESNEKMIDDTRIARTNNRNVVDDTRITRANNKNTIDNTKTTNKQAAISNTNKKNSKRKRRHKKISVRFIIVYLIVVLTGGFCLYRMGFPDKVVEMLNFFLQFRNQILFLYYLKQYNNGRYINQSFGFNNSLCYCMYYLLYL